MAAAQAYRPTVSQYDGNGATRLRNTRTNNSQHQQQQSTVNTTTPGGPCSQQYASNIGGGGGCSSNSGNGSTIAISTITNAPSLSRVRWFDALSFFLPIFCCQNVFVCTRRCSYEQIVILYPQKDQKNRLQTCPINDNRLWWFFFVLFFLSNEITHFFSSKNENVTA